MTTDGGRSKARLAAWPAIAALCALFLGFLPHTAAAQPTAGSYDYSNSYEVVIGVGKSQVIQLPTPYTDVMIADPKIADILPLNTRSLYVVGKSVGATASLSDPLWFA